MAPRKNRLSCDRCHTQKLRCPRQDSNDDKGCHRCVAQGLQCVYSRPLPKGRPRTNAIATTTAPTPDPTQVGATGTNLACSISSSPNDPSTSPYFNRLPLREDANTTMTTSESMNPIMNSSTFLQSQLEGQKWSGALANLRLEGDIFAPSQPHVNLQVNLHDPLRFIGSDDGDKSDLLPAGYMGLSNASRPRYVESAFWALVHGQEPLCDKFLDATLGSSRTTELSYINAAGLANLVEGIPTNAVCDVLLYSFQIGVRPIHPLIHLPTFRKDYNAFWYWCKHGNTSAPDPVMEDPTFIPLLFSVLFCGSVAAPVSFWSGAEPLSGLDMGSTVAQLRHSYLKGLECCQYTRRPTLNTLVASLLGRSCSRPASEALENLSFISMVVRIAHSMGLHRENIPAGLDPITHEMHRRIWWHVVCLDTQYSFRYGSQPCCGTEGYQWDVQMVSESSDEAMSDFQPGVFASVLTPSSTTTSLFMLFATGRYETSRFMHGLLNQVNSCHHFNQADLNLCLGDLKKLHIKINALINRMPAQGVPEKGFVPSRLANASMLAHENLYTGQSEEPSVFISWARITLTMLMTSSLLGLQKIFLGHPNLRPEQSEKLWMSTFHLSIDYIHHLHQITRVPAFTPYLWFFTTNLHTVQAILIILSYLRHDPYCQDAQIARYLVDEALEVLETSDISTRLATPTNEDLSVDNEDRSIDAESENGPPAVWRLLKAMRMELDTLMVQKPAVPDNDQFINNNEVSGPNSLSCIATSPPASFSQQPQHTSTAPSFSPNGQNQPQTSPDFSADDMSLGFGFDFDSISSFPAGAVAEGQAPSEEPGTGLDISDLDLWSSILLQGSEDLPMIGDFPSIMSPWR